MAWKYVNKKVPTNVAFMETDDDIRALLNLFDIEETTWFDTSFGWSPYGPYWEGDVLGNNGDVLLSYDFIETGETARIFRVKH